MKDIRLQPDGDLAVDTFDLGIVSGADQVSQRLQTRLRSVLGEWYLDPSFGVPYFEEILVKNPDLSRVTAVLNDAVLADPEVLEITSYDVRYEEPRRLFYDFECMSVYGSVTVSGSV